MDMEHYRAVRSGLDMSKRIAFYLEMSDPAGYPPECRAKTILAANDIFQGRSDRSVEDLLNEVTRKAGDYYAGEIAALRQEARSFLEQKALLSHPYIKTSEKQYKFRTMDLDPARPLKIINQQTYDRAVKVGFPPGFFRESYFDQVVLYCMPNDADFNFFRFQNCAFAVCHIQSATFDGARIYDCEFYTTQLDHVTFVNATIAHTRFEDSSLTWVSFQGARLKNCSTLDCILENVDFLDATLDGCSYGRVTAIGTRSLLTANITQAGATAEEVSKNQAALLQALAPRNVPAVSRTKRGLLR